MCPQGDAYLFFQTKDRSGTRIFFLTKDKSKMLPKRNIHSRIQVSDQLGNARLPSSQSCGSGDAYLFFQTKDRSHTCFPRETWTTRFKSLTSLELPGPIVTSLSKGRGGRIFDLFQKKDTISPTTAPQKKLRLQYSQIYY